MSALNSNIFITIIMLLVAGSYASWFWHRATAEWSEDEAEAKFFGIYGFAFILALYGIYRLVY